MELDATFRKALKLLHTRTEEAGLQLRQMLEDARLQKRVNIIKESKLCIKVENETGKLNLKKPVKEVNDLLPGASSKHCQEDGRKKETEKRQLEKSKHDGIEFIHEFLQESKRCKVENIQQYSYTPPSPELPKVDVIFSIKVEDDTDNSDGNADDFAMEMGLACIICKQIDVTQGNQLIECQECHSLYHQECHRPPATDHDVNDPRRVWYCAKCTKNMKKLANKTQKTSKNTSTAIGKESPSQSRSIKCESSAQAILLPFKRTELKAPVSQGNNLSSANKPIGLAGLAANLSGKTATVVPPPLTPPPSCSTSASSPSASSSSSGTIIRTNIKSIASSKAKSFGSYNALVTHVSSKSAPQVAQSSIKTLPSSTTSSTKINSVSGFTSQSASTSSVVVIPKSSNSLSNSLSKTNNSVLSSLISVPSNRIGSSGNGNNSGMAAGGAKPASSSSLMSADKRLQIMKKKAAKMQEKRRLSSK